MNPEIQPTSPLDLAGVAVATPAAGLEKMKVFFDWLVGALSGPVPWECHGCLLFSITRKPKKIEIARSIFARHLIIPGT